MMNHVQFSGITRISLDVSSRMKTERGHSYLADRNGLDEMLLQGIQDEMDRVQNGNPAYLVSAFNVPGKYEAVVIDGQDLVDFALARLQMQQQFLVSAQERKRTKRFWDVVPEEALSHASVPRFDWTTSYDRDVYNRDRVLHLAEQEVIKQYSAKADEPRPGRKVIMLTA